MPLKDLEISRDLKSHAATIKAVAALGVYMCMPLHSLCSSYSFWRAPFRKIGLIYAARGWASGSYVDRVPRCCDGALTDAWGRGGAGEIEVGDKIAEVTIDVSGAALVASLLLPPKAP